MEKFDSQHNASPFIPEVPTLIIAASFFLPVALPAIFGWLNGLLAVPVFYLLQTNENNQQVTKQIRNGILLAVVGSFIIQQLALIVFALTWLPLGYSFYQSASSGDNPVTTGLKGVINLTLSWLLFWTLYGFIEGNNPYTSVLTMLSMTLDQVVTLYKSNSELPPDVIYNLTQIIETIRAIIPRILPGLLAGSVLVTVWLNQLVSIRVLRRFRADRLPWPGYDKWQLPDSVVWLAIIAVILSLVGNDSLNTIGYNLAIVAVLLYFFQGMTVLVHILNRFNVPVYLRMVLYIVFVFQSYGLLLLSLTGLIDIWLNIRKLEPDE